MCPTVYSSNKRRTHNNIYFTGILLSKEAAIEGIAIVVATGKVDIMCVFVLVKRRSVAGRHALLSRVLSKRITTVSPPKDFLLTMVRAYMAHALNSNNYPGPFIRVLT